MTQMEKYIGTVLDDRYELKEILGVGGMAVVFLAYDRLEEREIALKMMKEDAASDETAVECFESESRAISLLSHPNIRQIYDISMSGQQKYLTMEYLDGPTLKNYVSSRGSISQDEALDFIVQILDALDHTHSKGIVHRDIKPQNIIIVSDNLVKITDFGIAKLYDPHSSEELETGVGTVYYISPEQASGKNIDARGDIYSVGIILYELICHRLPFVAENPDEVAYMQVTAEPQKPSEIVDLPVGLEQIIMRAIAKDPDERFSDAGQMLAALRRFKETPEAVFDFVSVPADSRFFESASSRSEQNKAQNTQNTNSGDSEVSEIKAPNSKKTSKRAERQAKKPKVIVKTEVKRKPTPVSFIAIICGSLLACLIVAVMTVYYVYNNFIAETLYSDESEIIVVENFVNRVCSDELIDTMEELGYTVNIVKQQSADYVIDTVISQSPEAGAKRVIIPGEKTCQITLYVSSGEEMTTLKNYVGLDYRDVKIDMNKIGFAQVKVDEYSAAVPAGCVTRTFPEAGAYITTDTEITVYVSLGQEVSYTTVPDLYKKSAIELRYALSNAGLLLSDVTYEYSSTIPEGEVIRQFPSANTVLPKYISSVSVVVSLGVDPSTLPPVTPDPELPEVTPDEGENDDAGDTDDTGDTENPGENEPSGDQNTQTP